MYETSKQWWEKVSSSEESLVAWLRRQFHGEVTAAERIEKYCLTTAPDEWVKTLMMIANQERKHASWIFQLLANRDSVPGPAHQNRYWEKTLGEIDSFESACATAAHAENMRLERIETIAYDQKAPADVKEVFEKILREEVFHAHAFERMAGSKAMAETLEAHIMGREAIGLINVKEVL